VVAAVATAVAVVAAVVVVVVVRGLVLPGNVNNVDSYRIGATELVQWAMDQVKIEGLQSIDQFAEAIKNHLTNTERNQKMLDSLPQSIAFQDQSIRRNTTSSSAGAAGTGSAEAAGAEAGAAGAAGSGSAAASHDVLYNFLSSRIAVKAVAGDAQYICRDSTTKSTRELSLDNLEAAANAIPSINFEIKLASDFKNRNFDFRANANRWFKVFGLKPNEEVPQISITDGSAKLKLKLKHFMVVRVVGEEFHSEESEDTLLLEDSDKEERAKEYIDEID
jgi:hypothetical protein